MSWLVLFEIAHDRIVDLKILIDRAIGKIVRSEVEEGVLLVGAQFFLELVALGAVDFLVGGDAAAAVDGTA